MRKHMLSRTCILVFVALVTLHLLISYASAQILYVDEDAAGGSGTSWADAFNSLQAAISASQSGDEIWVVKGEYKPDEGSGNRTATFALKASTQLYGGFAGNETALEQRNWRVNETILSGDLNGDDTHTRTPLDQYYHGNYEENSYHIITISAGEPIIDGFIITGGNADGATPHNYGGGIRVFGTAVSPQIANCMFLANRANYGGAIHCEFSNPKILQCFFSANDAELTGGAIYYYAIDGYAFVLNSTFSNNDANGNHGDGIFFYSDTNDHSGGLLLQNSIFWGESIGVNSANKQIGVTNEGDESNYYLNVLYSTVQGGANAIEHDGVGETFDHILDGNPEFTDPDGTDDAAGTRDDNLHLQANSPCVDAGNNTFDADGGAVIDSDPVPLDVDFDLHGRIYNDTIDMGVYERTRMIHVNGGATGNNDGTNWRDAFRYLQDGLSAAQSGNEIWVAEGNYKPTYGVAQPGDTVEMKREYTFALKSGVGIYGGFTGGMPLLSTVASGPTLPSRAAACHPLVAYSTAGFYRTRPKKAVDFTLRSTVTSG